MENAIIIIAVAAVLAAGVFIFINKGRKRKSLFIAEIPEQVPRFTNSIAADPKKDELIIPIETLLAEDLPDEKKLVEITDSRVLAHVSSIIPGLVKAGSGLRKVIQDGRTNGDVLYRAIIPSGAKLANSKSMEGAVRGIYHGSDGIQGHANLVAVEAKKGTAVLSSAMGIASVIVSQYYMNQINKELSEISESVSKIVEFQDNEYRSRVNSLVAHVNRISVFQTEILENDELRLSKISQLDSLEVESTQLLEQANLTLAGFAKRTELDYDAYEKALYEAHNWFMYQKTLTGVLFRIAELRYTLHIGTVSREQCTALLPAYSKQVSDTQKQLTHWHNKTTERLGISTKEKRRKRDGFDGAIHFLPGLFNDELNFCSIKTDTVKMITDQTSGHGDIRFPDESELYNTDVQLISKDGKVYYLPDRDDTSSETADHALLNPNQTK